MQEEEDLGRVGIALGEGKEVEVVVADVEVLHARTHARHAPAAAEGMTSASSTCRRPRTPGPTRMPLLTLMPSCEKQGGTAEDSSSASERRMGNFSTADMGMSPL